MRGCSFEKLVLPLAFSAKSALRLPLGIPWSEKFLIN
jgi:hypothetical protein